MAGQHNFECEQGATFLRNLTWLQSDKVTPVDVTGFTAKMQVRDTTNALVIELSTVNGGIILGGTLGIITLKIVSAITSLLAAGEYNYDLELYGPGSEVPTYRILEGLFNVEAQVTV